MKKVILFFILFTARSLGVFAIARRLTARDLRIICYHGAALKDEDAFRPSVFMRGSTFGQRMDYLTNSRYPVVSLDQGLDLLRQGTLPRCATVITIDDGWYGTYDVMFPILRRHGFPATLYIASYYLEKQTQVFNIAVEYAMWKAESRVLDLSQVDNRLAGSYDLEDAKQIDEAYRKLNGFAETLHSADERQALFRKLCSAIGVDWRQIEADRIAGFINEAEAREILEARIDIQLHTHRHRFPIGDFEQVRTEIEDNRRVLSRISDLPLRHFCYPSGYYEKKQICWLKRLDITAATTTESGFNRRTTDSYELKRFLDSERISQLEFEAEMSGFFELIRRCGYSI